MKVAGQGRAPPTLSPGKSPGTHFTGGWLGPRVILDECGEDKCLLLTPEFEPPTVAIPTTLSWPVPLCRWEDNTEITFRAIMCEEMEWI
jgi:hypothetical protein